MKESQSDVSVVHDRTNGFHHLCYKGFQLVLNLLSWVMDAWALIVLKKGHGKLYQAATFRSITNCEIWKWCLAGEDSYHPSIYEELNNTIYCFNWTQYFLVSCYQAVPFKLLHGTMSSIQLFFLVWEISSVGNLKREPFRLHFMFVKL